MSMLSFMKMVNSTEAIKHGVFCSVFVCHDNCKTLNQRGHEISMPSLKVVGQRGDACVHFADNR